jgi:hypothetical protein
MMPPVCSSCEIIAGLFTPPIPPMRGPPPPL